MNFTDNVEAYTGAAALDIDLIRVPGRNGLDLTLAIRYSSRIYDGATRSNLTDATGVLGLGWALATEAIVAVAGTAVADVTYYLVSGAESGRLVCVATEPDGTQVYQGENFQFWQIRYAPALGRWTVIREDGNTYVYGDSSSGRSTVQWGIAWDAWSGASSLASGQTVVPIVFSLSEISNRFGDCITWAYDQVVQVVGAQSGPTAAIYTQASYLSKVTSVTGDYVVLTYADKENDATNQEYVVSHTNPAPPNAWQDRYQTRYLASLTLYAPDGTPRFTQQLQYAAGGATAFLGTGPFAKRLLTGIIQTPAGSAAHLPGPKFSYCGQDAGDQVSVSSPFNATTKCLYGAIKQATAPSGGTITSQYGSVAPALSSRTSVITPPVVAGTTFGGPRFKFQDAYVVATWLGSDTTLRVQAYTWDARWLAPSQTAGLDSLPLSAAAAYDAVPIATSKSLFGAYSQNQVHLYYANTAQAGAWVQPSVNGANYFTTAYGAAEAVRLGAGNRFAVTLGLTGGEIRPFRFTGATWVADPAQTVAVGGAGAFDLAAHGNYALAAGTLQAAGSNLVLLKLAIATVTGPLSWSSSQIARQLSQVDKLALFAGDTFAVVMLTAADAAGQDAQYLAIWWDETGATLQTQPLALLSVATGTAPVPAASGSSIVIGQMVFRFNGAEWSYQNLGSSALAIATATAADVVVRTLQSGPSQINYDLTAYNPNAGTWSSRVNIAATSANAVIAAARSPGQSQYAIVGGSIYCQQPDGTWHATAAQLPVLSGNDALSPVVASNRVIVYQNAGNVDAFDLMDGSVTALPPIAGVSVYTPATGLVGNTAFVTYTGVFDSAQSTLTLYRAVDDAVTGGMQSYAVIARILSNGYQAVPTSYVYDAVYALSGSERSLRSNHTASCAGSSDGVTRPSGWIDSYYFNGLDASETPALAYPVDASNTNAASYYSVVAGSLYCMRTFPAGAAAAAFQSQDTNYLWVAAAVLGSLATGYYIRTRKVASIIDSVPSSALSTYSPDTGLVVQYAASNFNSAGQAEQVATLYNYFWEQYDTSRALNLLTPLIQTTKQTTVGSNTTTTGLHVTTYKQDWGSGQGRWAPDRTYSALSGTPPTFTNWNGGDPASGWLRTSTFLAVTPTGQPLRTLSVDGVVSAFVYDTDQHMTVATFQNADPDAGEASYYGFDPYESAGPWGWTGGGALADHITTSDCHTGVQSLVLPPVPAQQTGPFARFQPGGQQRTFVFGLWFKAQPTFNPAQGAAAASIAVWTVGASPTLLTTLTIPLADTQNQWSYAQQTINLPAIRAAGSVPAATPLAIRISAWNQNSTNWMLVDNLRFSPVDATFAASVYDPVSRLVTASIGNNGELSRTVYDTYDRTTALIGPNEQVKAVMSESYSRDAGATDTFLPKFPNTTLSLATTQLSRYYDFRDATASDWTFNGAGGTWSVTSGQLAFTGTATDPLGATAVLGIFAFTNFGMRVLCTSATAAAGIGNGDAFVFWDTGSKSWQLVRRQVSGPPTLAAKSSAIGFRDDWIFVIIDGLLLFYAGGVQVFAYDYQNPNTSLPALGKPALMASGAAAFDDVVVLDNPQLSLTFMDGGGTELQRVALLGYSSGSSGYAVQGTGVFLDSLGRPYVNRNPGAPLLALAAPNASGSPTTADLVAADQTTYLVNSLGQTVTLQQYLGGTYGYDFTQSQYEPAPLSRVTAVTLPRETGTTAANFTVSYGYAAATAQIGQGILPAGTEQNYLVQTTTNADGVAGYRILDTLGKLIAVRVQLPSGYQTSSVQYDAFGNVVTLLPPNYYNPPAGSQASAWTETRTYTFNNLLASRTTPDAGTVQYLYDSATHLRFSSTADGAAATPPLFLYVKYDALGRAIEEGYIQDAGVTWASLANQVNVPTYPDITTVAGAWARKRVYDVAQGGSALNLLGRLWSVTTNEGASVATQTFAYDASGNVTSITTTAPALDPAPYTCTFTYDNQNHQVVTTYPYKSGETPFQVAYYYDRLGRTAAIGKPVPGDVVVDPSAPASGNEDLYAAYVYGPNGRVSAAVLNNNGANAFTRSFTYDAPGWLTQIDDPFFNENSAYYEQPGTDGATRRSGIVSQDAVTHKPAPGVPAPAPFAYGFAYDALSRLTSAQCTAIPSASLAMPTGGIDANGNLVQLTYGATAETFSYRQSASSAVPANNRLFNVSQSVSTTIDFTAAVPGWSWGASNGGPSASSVIAANAGKALQLVAGSLGHYERLRLDSYLAPGGVYNLNYRVMTPSGFTQLPGDAGWYLVGSAPDGSIVTKPLGALPDTAGAWQAASISGIDLGALVAAEAGGANLTDAAIELRNYKRGGVSAASTLAVTSITLATQAAVAGAAYAYSPSGLVTSTPSITQITYDPVLARPATAQAPAGAVTWRYDGSGSRLAMTAAGATRAYWRDTDARPLRVDTTAAGQTQTVFNVYGPQGLVGVQRPTGFHFTLKDRMGSTRTIVDTTGTRLATYDYLPFGGMLRTSGSSQDTDQLFTGQVLDAATTLYAFPERHYDTALGRFYAPDPAAQYPSPYLYGGGDWMNQVDPSGAMFKPLPLGDALQGLYSVASTFVDEHPYIVGGVATAAAVGTAAYFFPVTVGAAVASAATWMWQHPRVVLGAALVGHRVYNAPSYTDLAIDIGADIAVSVVSAHTLMRAVRGFDAAFISVRLPIFVWPLGLSAVMFEGAAKGQGRRLVRYWLGREGPDPGTTFFESSDMKFDALSNVVAHVLFNGLDFRTAVSPRASYPHGNIHVFYLKFPNLRHFDRWEFWRGWLVPYKGIASGGGSPAALAAHRHAGHHWNAYGFGPHVALAASDDQPAIQYLERLLIQYLGPAAHITGAAGFQQDYGIGTPAALGWYPNFVREFVWWHFYYAAQHLQTPVEWLANNTWVFINGQGPRK